MLSMPSPSPDRMDSPIWTWGVIEDPPELI